MGRRSNKDPPAAELRAHHARLMERHSFVSDVTTGRWLVAPVSALRLALLFVAAYVAWEYLAPVAWNPIRPFLFISYRLPATEVVIAESKRHMFGPKPTYSLDNPLLTAIRSFCHLVHFKLLPKEAPFLRYGKGWLDVCFIAYYVIVFSFLRQTLTLHVFRPLAQRLGIRSEAKLNRFAEQGYGLMYWGTTSLVGVYVMSFQDSWWYNFEHFWYQYPHWQMRRELKLYYLLQGSFWLQQAFVMLLRLERPRKDYYELVAHHLVTLWLIGWSYFINLNQIGTSVFVCMDIPDTFLALSKLLNYLDLNLAAATTYTLFMVIWSYFRIYLSARTLASVYFDYHKIPEYARTFFPSRGHWLVWWMQCHVFAPLLLLLLLNIFWYVIMWRVFANAIRGVYGDEREDGEFDDDEEPKKDK
ncbi:sphingosine N-acyltransferase [Malassezia cuniculi]|uniref:Sphingosine N-acyltransferase n=1 Tax=Malassezia cuniculi TaxID=948313 RepID=A0AAF0J6L8_9BASI|nr:sphingosine N-acyltransferase [Malassezia cuniculi]